ncbi:MAG: hypothetical protein R3C14_33350 [Caldilineaceae bacterium]
MFRKIEGYLAIPQMIVYTWAHRLIGKSSHYQLGQNVLRAAEPRTARERIFVLLFPLGIFGGAGLLAMAGWALFFLQAGYHPDLLVYLRTAPLWHQALWWIGLLCILYASFSVHKLPYIIRLLCHELSHKPPQRSNNYQYNRKSHQ